MPPATLTGRVRELAMAAAMAPTSECIAVWRVIAMERLEFMVAA